MVRIAQKSSSAGFSVVGSHGLRPDALSLSSDRQAGRICIKLVKVVHGSGVLSNLARITCTHAATNFRQACAFELLPLLLPLHCMNGQSPWFKMTASVASTA